MILNDRIMRHALQSSLCLEVNEDGWPRRGSLDFSDTDVA